MQTQINDAKISAVQAACDEAAWLFAESGGKDGFVDVTYKPSRRHTSEQIFARLVQLWDSIDRPNAEISLVKVGAAESALRRTSTTKIRVKLIEPNE